MVTPKDDVGAVRYVKTPLVLDSIAAWAATAGEIGVGPDGKDAPFPVTLELLKGSISELPKQIATFVDRLNKEKDLKLKPPLFQVSARDLGDRDRVDPEETGSRVYSILTNKSLFDLIALVAKLDISDSPFELFKIFEFGAALPEDALGKQEALEPVNVPNKPPKKGLVITAVIDTGIPFLNQVFCTSQTESRVRYAWVQDGRARTSGQFVPFGREFDQSQINTLLTTFSQDGPVTDELDAYRTEGLADFTRKAGHPLGYVSTHGGYVGGAAAGYPMGEATTDDAIIFVQLPDTIVADASGTTLGPFFVAAVEYILERADRVAQAEGCGELPVVINFSFGGTGGPLDGTSPIERYMDWRIKKRDQTVPGKTAILPPAGNSYLSRCHARLTEGKNFTCAQQTDVLTWQVQPDDHTASFVEIWTPKRAITHRCCCLRRRVRPTTCLLAVRMWPGWPMNGSGRQPIVASSRSPCIPRGAMTRSSPWHRRVHGKLLSRMSG